MADDAADRSPAATGEGEELRLFNASDLKLRRDDFGRLHATLAAKEHSDVQLRLAFPLSVPDGYVVLLDAEEREIGLVPELRGLDRDSRRLLEEELELAYFAPKVLRITYADSRHGVTTWDLDTDRGPRRIHVRDRSDIRHINGKKIVFVDMHGVKYEIPDVTELDLASLRRLEAES